MGWKTEQNEQKRSLRKTGKEEREQKDIKTFNDNHVKRDKMDVVDENYFNTLTTRNSWLQPIQHQVSYRRHIQICYMFMLNKHKALLGANVVCR